MRDLKLLVGIPSGDIWNSDFGMSLAMFMNEMQRPVPGCRSVSMRVSNIKGSILSRQRHMLVQEAEKWGADYILFIDSDQKFPPNLFHRLYSHRKWVIGANVATRIFPSKPTARKRSDTLVGDPVYTTPHSPELEKVWMLGTGVLLVDMKVFKKIPPPWFEITWVPELNDYRGEDWTFMMKLEEAGIARWVDHHLSVGIGHIGQFVYGHDVVEVDTVPEQKVLAGA